MKNLLKIFLVCSIIPFFNLDVQAMEEPLAVLEVGAEIADGKSDPRFKVEFFPQRDALCKKLVIHNYNDGEKDLLLSWGYTWFSMNLLRDNILKFKMGSNPTVAVIGFGVGGLTMAHWLRDAGYEVVLYAEDFSPHTISTSEGDFWVLASAQENRGESQAIKKRNEDIKDLSFRIFKKIADTKAANENPQYEGVSWVGGNIFIDTSVYVNSLFEDAKKREVTFKKYPFNCLEDVLSLEESVIINCGGLVHIV